MGRLGVLALLVVTAACSANAVPEGPIAKRSQAIIAGKASANESILQLAIKDEGHTVYTKGCSASLVAKNLVMTARHCVSDFDAQTGEVTTNYAAPLFFVFTGADAPTHLSDGTEPAAQGAAMILPDGKSLLPDIAFIVLAQPVADAKIAALRLTGPPVKGEELTLVGFGLTEAGFPSERQERKGVPILGVGPHTGTFHDANAGEFMIGEAACFGDSGGAAISSKTGAIVGVTSRVQNGRDETAAEPHAPCVGPNAEDIFTSVPAMKAVLDRAFVAAGTTPIVEQGTPVGPESRPDVLPPTPVTAKPVEAAPASAPAKEPMLDLSCTTTPRPRGGSPVAIAGMAIAALVIAGRRRRR